MLKEEKQLYHAAIQLFRNGAGRQMYLPSSAYLRSPHEWHVTDESLMCLITAIPNEYAKEASVNHILLSQAFALLNRDVCDLPSGAFFGMINMGNAFATPAFFTAKRPNRVFTGETRIIVRIQGVDRAIVYSFGGPEDDISPVIDQLPVLKGLTPS